MRKNSTSMFSSVHRGFLLTILGSLLIASVFVSSASAQTGVVAQPKSDPLKDLKYRLIGPFRGGRSVAVVGDHTKPQVFYFGAVNGGVWKTTNAGAAWENITDGKTDISSVGAISVAPSDPNVIYVGGGESELREDLTYGNGVYRTTDAGATWHHLGLPNSHTITAIRIDEPQRIVHRVGIRMESLWPVEDPFDGRSAFTNEQRVRRDESCHRPRQVARLEIVQAALPIAFLLGEAVVCLERLRRVGMPGGAKRIVGSFLD